VAIALELERTSAPTLAEILRSHFVEVVSDGWTRSHALLKNHHQAPTRNDRCARNTSGRANDLQITSQPEPRSDVKVVKHFKLMLGARASARLGEQVEVVLENTAKVGERVGDAELVPWPTLE
jgi:hypothetical protein